MAQIIQDVGYLRNRELAAHRKNNRPFMHGICGLQKNVEDREADADIQLRINIP
jgi:hypothetical protein